MKTYTRAEILANRTKWIEFQSVPSRRKATGALDRGDGKRCCLGHACFSLGIPKFQHSSDIHYGEKGDEEYLDGDHSYTELPEYVAEMLGMWSNEGDILADPKKEYEKSETKWGDFAYVEFEGFRFYSLILLNDESNFSASRIGRYLASVIEGGYETPFKPLTDFPETV